MITKLMEWAKAISTETAYSCSKCSNGKNSKGSIPESKLIKEYGAMKCPYCGMVLNYMMDKAGYTNIYPELNPEKAWKLEEMILKVKQDIRYRLWGDPEDLEYKIQCLTFGLCSDWCDTRNKALASLITQINWSEQELEQIRGILSNG